MKRPPHVGLGPVAGVFDAATGAGGVFANNLDPDAQRIDQLYKGIDVATDNAPASFHSLDGWNGQSGQIGKLALINT